MKYKAVKIFHVIWPFLSFFIIINCFCFNSFAENQNPPASNIPLVENILYETDFSKNDGWKVKRFNEGSLKRIDGEYQFSFNTENILMHSELPTKVKLDNVNISVSTELRVLAGNATCGIIFNYNDEEKPFYSFIINPAIQSYTVLKHSKLGSMFYRQVVVEGKKILYMNPTNQVNQLQLIQQNNQVKFLINNQLVETVNIESPPGKFKVGLIAISITSNCKVGFDNFKVRKILGDNDLSINNRADSVPAVIFTKEIFYDDFNNPGDTWATREDVNSSSKYRDGLYEIALFKENWRVRRTPKNFLIPGKHFLIQADMSLAKKGAGIYGLTFRSESNKNIHYSFEVDPEEKTFSIIKTDSSNDNWSYLIAWSNSQFIDSNKNQLKIEQNDNLMKVFVNGHYLKELTINIGDGQLLPGILAISKSKPVNILIDNFRVLTPFDSVPAVIFTNEIFYDDFNNPGDRWATREDVNSSSKYRDGLYEIAFFKENWNVRRTPKNFLIPGNLFLVQADMSLAKKGPGIYGLTFRSESNKNIHYSFEVDPEEKTFSIRKTDSSNNSSSYLKGWSYSQFIDSNKNQLKIEQNDNLMKVFVNGHYLTELTINLGDGSLLPGIGARSKSKPVTILVDNFRVMTP